MGSLVGGQEAEMNVTRPLKRRALCELVDDSNAGHPEPKIGEVDRSRLFICPTLTPLYYTPAYEWLTAEQRLRYNQLAGMQFNEVIMLFETAFSPALERIRDEAWGHDDMLARCLDRFVIDERRHIQHWRNLNRASEPAWYNDADYPITRVQPLFRRVLRRITPLAPRWPALIWFTLAMEERALHMARLTLRRGDEIDPAYRAAYRAHTVDEVRHVQMDWHLLDRFYATASERRRRMNATIAAWMLCEVLVPKRAALRVIAALAREHPQIAQWQPTIRRQLEDLQHDPAYNSVMYSRSMTPLLFHLCDQYPEMRAAMQQLPSYQAEPAGT